LLFALLLTGLFIFKIDFFTSIYPSLGEINLRLLVAYHWYVSIALLDLAIIHIFYNSIIINKLSTIWITRVDVTNLLTITRNFFVISKDYPKMKKLHPMQKIFHISLVIVTFFLGFTGLTIWEPFLMFLRNIGLGFMENWFYITNSRYLHDLFTFLFIALMIGHFYFSTLVPTNWKVFRGMTHGQLLNQSKKSEKKSKES
ncbi:cytochrome b/b6 domain-containing protein, partial [Thermoproteota archaeon]